MTNLTPQAIVDELDKYIIGQNTAKRAVAIALRNRWRRMHIDEPMRNEITPKNILMIGPTGVGKTEIARRLAKLARAPFIKVEATKFTEVGYVGRDVESIIRDLADVAIKQTREYEKGKVYDKAQELAIDRVLDILLPPARMVGEDSNKSKNNQTRNKFRQKIINGEFDDKEINIELKTPNIGVEIMAPPGMEDMTNQLQGMFQNIGSGKKQTRVLKIKKALKSLEEEEMSSLINEDEIKEKAIKNVEQNGIVFIDELDKVTRRADTSNADISREGVQRDLLPLIEGSTVSTKYGIVKTDHILFIASGSFHLSKPSDLIPELQGRLPIRVELNALTANDFARILTEPNVSLTEQYELLLKTENVCIKFRKEGVQRLAEIACQVNERTENIGARRLHTVMERLLETLSFEADEKKDKTISIDKKYVNQYLEEIVKDEDLSRYIL